MICPTKRGTLQSSRCISAQKEDQNQDNQFAEIPIEKSNTNQKPSINHDPAIRTLPNKGNMPKTYPNYSRNDPPVFATCSS